MLILPHRFRPPKKAHKKQWELVKFMIDNGFYYQHIYQKDSSELVSKRYENYIPYPKNLREAKKFVIQYKDKARK